MVKRAHEAKAPEMISRQFVITNELGLHLRPAGLLVKTANNYEASITVEKDGMQADGKSIIEITSLHAECNAIITVRACGPDAREALAALESLITNSFYEPHAHINKPEEPPA